MEIVIYFRKNLKMSVGKIASQCSHVAKELGRTIESDYSTDHIIVLQASDKKFWEMVNTHGKCNGHIQYDSGLTELDPNTATAFGYIRKY